MFDHRRVGIGVNGDGFVVGHPVVARAASANEVDLEGSVTEFEVGVQGKAAFVVRHPKIQPALVASRGSHGFTAELDQPAGFPVLQFDFTDFGAGHLAEERLLVLQNVPDDGFALFPRMGPHVVEHGAEVLAGTVRQVKVLLRLVRGGPEAAQLHGIFGDGPADADVAALAAVLAVFEGAPRPDLGEGNKMAADGVEGFNRAAGAEIEIEILDPLLAGFGSGGEGALGGGDQAPFDEVSEFFALGPGEGGSGEMLDGKNE